MITIRNFNDLRPFGINALTGEACRVGTRILCDLTYEGEKIVCDLLGLNYVSYSKYRTFPSNWNGGSAYVSSFMMPDGLFEDLAAWCLIHKGCKRILVVRGCSQDGVRWDTGIYGQEGEIDKGLQEQLDHYKHYNVNFRLIKVNTDLPGEGTRCEHQMSGRTT